MKYLVGIFLSSTLLFGANEQLIIDAKNFEANDTKGISIFTGDVKIKMGKDKLNANKVEINFVTDKKTNAKTPSTYEATGNVDFELFSKNKNYVGKGEKVIYSPSKEEYTIIGNGYLEEKNDGRKIYGDTIFVNQLTGEARVKGSTSKPVRFIINVEKGTDQEAAK